MASISIKRCQTITTKTVMTLRGEDIINVLREAGFDVALNATVIFPVPGGGDYSNVDIDVDAECPVLVSWEVIT